jgi:hypothetical protein
VEHGDTYGEGEGDDDDGRTVKSLLEACKTLGEEMIAERPEQQ